MPPYFPRKQFENRLNLIEGKVTRLRQLKELNIPNGKVLNIGCTSEIEPIALMWVLNTDNVTGLNIDITQAQQFCSEFEEMLNDGREACRYAYTSEKDRLFWERRVPDFLKEGILPTLVEEDILQRLQPRNYYDLVYSSGVLKHIDEVKSAIDEMRQVVKLGGWVVTDGTQHGKFRQIFEQVGLELSDDKSDALLESYRKIKS